MVRDDERVPEVAGVGFEEDDERSDPGRGFPRGVTDEVVAQAGPQPVEGR